MAPVDLPGARQQDVVENRLKNRLDYAQEVINRDLGDYELLDAYHKGDQLHPFVPSFASDETKEINKRSITNLMKLAVKIPAQMTFMDTCVRGKDPAPKEWKVGYSDSGFSTRQTTLATTALKYGHAFVGLENLGQKKPIPKLYSTKNTAAIFTDPVNDVYPLYLVTVHSQPRDKNNPGSATYMDSKQVIQYEINDNGDWKIIGKPMLHKLGHTPAVRFIVDIDDEGNVTGAIEPLIEFQNAINQAKQALLRNNAYSAEKVRTAAGVVGEPRLDKDGNVMYDENGKILYQAMQWGSGRVVTTENEQAKFSTLDETPADGFIATMEELIREFAVAAQIPPHALLGNLSNLSADTLVAALGQTLRLVFTLQTTWGHSHRSLLRLMAIDLGEITADEDYEGEPQWRDMSDRAFGAIIDGLGKMSQMLGIPRKALWRWVPGVTGGEMEIWEEMYEKEQAELAEMAQQANTPQNAALRERRPRPGRGNVNDASGAAGSGGVAPSSAS